MTSSLHAFDSDQPSFSLDTLGFTPAWAATFAPFAERGLIPGRVAADLGPSFRVYTSQGDVLAEIAGRLRHQASSRSALPAVGDFVALQPREAGRAKIEAVLPRRTRLSRQVAGGTTDEQVVAANIDTVFLMAGLDGDFNPRRLERALLLTWEGGAEPVIVLNKTDICADLAARRAQLDGVAAGVALVSLSAATGEGVAALAPWLGAGRTVALLGSSGVGKSTLTNRLLGEARQATRAVRTGDDRGRHTTTHRELLLLPGGALLIDTPGLRELTLWADDQALHTAFTDVDGWAQQCGFGDCTHRTEPRCAVQAAVASGQLAPERLASFFKLQAELRYLALRQDGRAQAVERQRWKSIHKAMRHVRPRH